MEKKKMEKKEKKDGRLRENIEMILEVLVVVFFINTFLIQTYGVPTPSMEGHMLVGDQLFVDKVAFSQSCNKIENFLLPKETVKRGNIVVFKSPPEVKAKNRLTLIYVKRVIGIPGDLIRMVNNKIYINGTPLEEPYLNLEADQRVPKDFPPQRQDLWWNEFPVEFREMLVETDLGMAFHVPEGYYFCMGDNRNLSADSRIWGPVPRENIIGKPWRVYWSHEKGYARERGRGIVKQIKNTVSDFFTKTRWSRFLKKY